MPGPPQGVLRFQGILSVKDWCYTLGHGISPGIAILKIAPQQDLPTDPGTMFITFGDLKLDFPFCIIDKASISRGRGGLITSVSIKDRRWAWQYTTPINGRYNVRLKGVPSDNTDSIDKSTKKNPQELAILLLKAMGEFGYDVSALSTLASPEVNWVFANPAHELAALVESLGCAVVLRLDGSVLIALLGQGADLPDGSVRTVGCGIDPPDKPDKLMVVGAATRYQTTFRLQAIGVEPDTIAGGVPDPLHPGDPEYPPVGFVTIHPGDLKPLKYLSYNPHPGLESGFGDEWMSEDGFSNIKDPRARRCAQETVMRWYQIKCTADSNTEGVFNIPGYKGQVKYLWQILPLEAGLVDTYTETVIEGITQSIFAPVQQPLPPQLKGTWFVENGDCDVMANNTRFPYRFSVERDHGYIQLPFCVEDFQSTATGRTYIPATLFLTIGHGVKDINTLQEDRFTKERTLPGETRGVGTQVLHRPDVVRLVISQYTDSFSFKNLVDTKDSADKEADYYLDAAQAQFEVLQTAQAEYAGIIPVSPDGAIQQVEWSGGPSGAITRIGRNNEFSLHIPKFKEKRRIEKQAQQAALVAKTALHLRGIGHQGGVR